MTTGEPLQIHNGRLLWTSSIEVWMLGRFLRLVELPLLHIVSLLDMLRATIALLSATIRTRALWGRCKLPPLPSAIVVSLRDLLRGLSFLALLRELHGQSRQVLLLQV